MKILIVDDDRPLAEGVELFLSVSNPSFEVFVECDGAAAITTIKKIQPDLIVLDVLLDEVSGFELCKEIKRIKNIPVIFLSSLGEAEDKIQGLMSGGDDYMCKPFSLQELLLRINARLNEKRVGEREQDSEITYDFGQVKVRQRTLIGTKKDVLLTETEHSILLLLARNQGMTISLREIYKVVWGEKYSGDLRTVQTHTANLRKKLEEAYGTNRHICTQWGQGYIFQA